MSPSSTSNWLFSKLHHLVILSNIIKLWPMTDTNLLILALNNFAHGRPSTDDTFMNTLSKLFTCIKL
jgi:hypothetical protein